MFRKSEWEKKNDRKTTKKKKKRFRVASDIFLRALEKRRNIFIACLLQQTTVHAALYTFIESYCVVVVVFFLIFKSTSTTFLDALIRSDVCRKNSIESFRWASLQGGVSISLSTHGPLTLTFTSLFISISSFPFTIHPSILPMQSFILSISFQFFHSFVLSFLLRFFHSGFVSGSI